MEPGYFAYRYKRKYYRQYLQYDAGAYKSGHGRRLANMVPRDPSALKDWVADRITMLENAKIREMKDIFDDVEHPNDGIGADDLGFNITYELDLLWRSYGERDIHWTYTIDLDNLVFTIDGMFHLRLDNMPPDLEDYTYQIDGDTPVPQECLCPKVDLWPSPGFDIEERQQKYKALQPMIVPATEWGAPTWDELTVSQRFSIEITHHLLRETSPRFAYAYVPCIRRHIGRFCWNVLCASVPALPISRGIVRKGETGYRTLSCGYTSSSWSIGAHVVMRSLEKGEPFQGLGRGLLLGSWLSHHFLHSSRRSHIRCPRSRANGPQDAVQRTFRIGWHHLVESAGAGGCGRGWCYGPTLSSTRHSYYALRRKARKGYRRTTAPDVSSESTSDCFSITMAYSTSSAAHCLFKHKTATRDSTNDHRLPRYTDLSRHVSCIKIHTLSMCRVSRSIRSVCVANPRIGDYTVLHRVQGFMSMFAVRCRNGELKNIELQWNDRHWEQWKAQEVSPEEFDKLKQEENTEKVFDVNMHSFHCTC